MSNLIKHGVDVADAATLADEFADEERFITVGMDALDRVLVIVYIWRGADVIRRISARKATPHERRQYQG